MKQKDIALIIIIVFVSGVFSLVVSGVIFSPKKKNLTSEIVQSVKSDFQKPDATVFNKDGLNPTQLIRIGDGTNNSAPF